MNFIKCLFSVSVSAMMLMTATSCVAVTGGDSVISGSEQIEGSGKIISKNIVVSSDFSGISVPSIIDVEIAQGSSNSIRIEGSDNLLQYCDVSVNENTLNIKLTKEAIHLSFKKFDVKVYVTAKTLNNIDISGTGDVDFKGEFNTSSLNFVISGTGDITIPALTASDFNVAIMGTGDVKAKGTCEKAELTVSGTGDIDAALTGLQTLKATISGTGDIDLSGSTMDAEYKTFGTGDIDAKNMKAKNVTASSMGTGEIECYASESFSGSKSKTAGLKCYGEPAKYNLNKY